MGYQVCSLSFWGLRTYREVVQDKVIRSETLDDPVFIIGGGISRNCEAKLFSAM